MVTAARSLRIPGFSKTPRVALLVVAALVGVLSFAIAFGTIIPPPNTAHAGGNEPWLYLECLDDEVDEGDDFRLQVRKKYKSHSPHKTMRVFWYTEAITAGETDYEHMYAVRQASNGHQSKTGKMGRTFHTLEDLFPETDETYLVRFNNSVDHGTDGECYITIKDDDGVGIHHLGIRSVPRELRLDDDGNETIEAYTTGDVILVTAHFNHPVTTVNPETGQQTDYAGLYLQVGENRRVAHVLRGDGTDNIIFGYTVQLDDMDLDGISVEGGGPGTGLYYNEDTRDGGIWPVSREDGRLNRLFHGLEDDPVHPVAQVEIDEPTITPPTEAPIDDEPPIIDPPPVDPTPGPWSERSVEIEGNLLTRVSGELTQEDEGRDWYSFAATGGETYIIELKNQMEYVESALGRSFSTLFVDGHLVDPSILEIVNEQGAQVMGERDQGGFLGNFARAYFTPDEDGMHYIAVGAGAQDRGSLGFYELSVRADDHADDFRAKPDVTLYPGESITACIDSDVSPDDPGLNPWDWWETGSEDNYAHPIHGLETLDDLDFLRFVIDEEGTYEISVSDGPESVGIWATYEENGNLRYHEWELPVQSRVEHFEPGTYVVEIGTPYQSAGNTGLYTVSLNRIQETGDVS